MTLLKDQQYRDMLRRIATSVAAEGTPGPKGDKGDPGAAGAKGDTGAQGPPGPAPSGTGYVHVTNGVLDTPAPTAAPATHGNTAHSEIYITAADIPAIPSVANTGETADCSTSAESDGTSPRYARADHVHKYTDTTGSGSLGWGLW